MKVARRAGGYQDFNPATNGEQRFIAHTPDIGRGVVLDVGANEGNWAQMLLASHPQARVHCFEPGGAAYRALIRTMGARVTSHNVAVSDQPGSVTLHALTESEMSSLIDRRGFEDAKDETVQAITIEDFLRTEEIDEVALLKIDTEGNELAVLRGAANCFPRIRRIQFEYGGTAVDARVFIRDFYDLLGESFDLYRLWRFGLIHEPVWSELLEVAAYQNWVCVRR